MFIVACHYVVERRLHKNEINKTTDNVLLIYESISASSNPFHHTAPPLNCLQLEHVTVSLESTKPRTLSVTLNAYRL